MFLTGHHKDIKGQKTSGMRQPIVYGTGKTISPWFCPFFIGLRDDSKMLLKAAYRKCVELFHSDPAEDDMREQLTALALNLMADIA